MSVLSVVATVLYVGAFRVAAEVAGLAGAVDGELWGALAATAGRALVMTLVATALGFGIATLGRHTAAALGVVAAYAVVWELGARVVMEIVEFARPERWMFSTYVGAWMVGEVQLWARAGSGCASDIAPCDWSYTISWVDATVVFLVLLGALLGSAFATFARRDLA